MGPEEGSLQASCDNDIDHEDQGGHRKGRKSGKEIRMILVRKWYQISSCYVLF